MLSHDALRLKLIYRNFRDVIILFGCSLNKHQHGVICDGESENCKCAAELSLVYVYCVSKEDFPVFPVGLGCVGLICRQVHVSFVDKMEERRISLIPLSNGRRRVEEMFANVNKPVLIPVRSSCDLKVSIRKLSFP